MRYLQEALGVSGFVTEFNITGELWTSRVTSHIPLAAVAAADNSRRRAQRGAHHRPKPSCRGQSRVRESQSPA